jgi:glycerophosphoryl diester phosphodiesterase
LNAPRKPSVWGHRGTRSSPHKPGPRENTLQAMRYALEQGADGIELDVRLCKSGEVIVLHDPDLVRVAGCALRAEDAMLEELRAFDVPSLDDAIDLVLGHGAQRARLNVEVKPDVPDVLVLTHAVARCLEARTPGEQARLLVSSFSSVICEAMLEALPGLDVAFLFEREVDELPEGISAVHPHHALLDAARVAGFHALGLQVNTWTVNDHARARMMADAGVDAIISDDVPVVLGAVSR